MNEKTFNTLEYNRILEQLAEATDFSASRELALTLRPTTKLLTAKRWQAETAEARTLLNTFPEISVGGARDVRELATAAKKGAVLFPPDLLDIKSTLISARKLQRMFEKENETFPNLFELSLGLPAGKGLIDAISKTISDKGEVLDSASTKLASVRKEKDVAHNRLQDKMHSLLNNSSIVSHLQEAIVTQRDGRYVIPIKATSKGRVKSVVHDQSASGATLFVEPLQVVELNNAWRNLQMEEKQEEQRVLAELSKVIGSQAEDLIQAVESLAALDLCFAKAKYAENLLATAPVLVPFEEKKGTHHPGATLNIRLARHPLLDPEFVVPVDIVLDEETYILVITGPNTGGKTVTLKTAGLLVLMAQSGMQIPASQGAEMSLFESVFADIGDEQSIEQSLSTFSGHITNIIQILKKAGNRSLVIIDELGAGTDPQEGAALAMAILEHLVEGGITTLVATHYPELKTYAHTSKGVVNASMQFDLKTLRPTYRLTIGLPGRSNALEIASRLGLQEDIIQRARDTIHPDDLKADALLDEIHRQRDLAVKERQEAETLRIKVETQRKELTERLDSIEDERIKMLEETREKQKREIRKIRNKLSKVRQQLAKAQQPLEALERAEQRADILEDQVEAAVPVREEPEEEFFEPAPIKKLKLGSKVRVRTLNQMGVVSSIGEEEVEVQIGVLRVKARPSDLEMKSGEPVVEAPKQESGVTGLKTFSHASPGVEVSLRGMRVDEALDVLDRHLEAAYLARLPYVRIVHGKGTGKLREAVQDALKNHSYLQRFEAGGEKEGGDGVTIAFLRQ
ncbi:MAG: endonuclease MutS2 [Anaerolineales bacterium]|nr:endonuclease MutS2 [Anaerolineales bacterium]